MSHARNTSITLLCCICDKPFHPWGGREATSPVCSRNCNGRYQTARRVKNELTEFNKRIKRSEGCWEWLGYVATNGYGLFICNSKVEFAHRYAAKVFKHVDIEGKVVAHHCDNPPCVNPDHLFVGSQLDNVKDMDAKGRRKNGAVPCGEEQHLHKLTESDVHRIRKDTRLPRIIADEYGVSVSAVRKVLWRTTWKHV